MARTIRCLSLLLFVGLFGRGNCQELTDADITSMLEANHCYNVSQSAENAAISQITLRFQYGLEPSDHISVPLNQSTSILNDTHFNTSSCMVVYVPGWLQKLDSKYSILGYRSFVKYCNCNLVMVDWTSVTSKLYHTSVGMTPNACKAIAHSLDAMINAGVTLCYLSGISLGGQCVGHTARNMKNRVRHVIAFDPAGPLFYEPVRCVSPISEKDADCVEIIHTDRGFLGAPNRTGTIDYWVNGGSRTQPGCELPTPQSNEPPTFCSHARSQSIFMETLRDPTLLPARQCTSELKFSFGGCAGNALAYVGQCNNQSIPGSYYLRTTGEAPYGLKLRGASPGV